jgi:WD40 repeat protein
MRAIISISFGVFAITASAADNPPPALSSKLPDGAIARIGAPEQRVRNEVYGLAYSPDGKRISVSVGYHVQILDADTGAEIRMLSKPEWRGLIREVRFTADGKWLVCQGMGDNQTPTSAILWNVDEGKESDRLLKGERYLMALSPDGKTAATLGREQLKSGTRYHFVLWDALSGAELGAIPTDGLTGMNYVRFSSDNKRLLIKLDRGGWCSLEIDRFMNRVPKRTVVDLKEPPSYGSIYDQRVLSPDGSLLVLAHSQGVGSRSVWTAYDTTTGKEVERLKERQGRFVGFDADGRRFLECIASYDHSLLEPLPDLPGMYALKKMMAGAFGILRLCETSTGKILQQWIVPLEEIRDTSFSPDGKALLIGVSYYLRKLELNVDPARALRIGWWRHRSTDVRFSPDGSALFVWEIDSRSRTICDPLTGAVKGHLRSDVAMDVGTLRRPLELMQLKEDKLEPAKGINPRGPLPPQNPHYQVMRSPDGKYLVAFTQVQTGYSPGSGHVHYGPGAPVELWQAKPLKRLITSATDKVEPRLIKHLAFEGLYNSGPQAFSIGFSPDASMYAWHDIEGTIHVWEIASGRKSTPLKYEGAGGSGAFSRDRRLLAVGGKDGIRLFEIASGSVRSSFGEKIAPASSVAFSADGTRMVSSHHDASILIWNALSGIKRAQPLDDKCWTSLSDASAANALPAMQQLAADPEAAVPWLREKLLKLTVPDPQKRIGELIEQLADDTFRIRRDAELELQRIGRPALPALEKASKSLSEDLAMRARKITEQIQARYPAPPFERMQALRGVEMLERFGTPKARAALGELASKAADAELRRDAKGALERLK